MTATLYKADGTREEITPRDGKAFTYDEIRSILGCHKLERINCGDPSMVMVGDEEARCFDDHIINREATRIFRDGHGIVGDVYAIFKANIAEMKARYGDSFIFCGDPDEEPYTIVGDVLYMPEMMTR